MKRIYTLALAFASVAVASSYACSDRNSAEATNTQKDSIAEGMATTQKYKEVSYPTPNIEYDKTNEVQGVILHHTAEPTVESSLEILSTGKKGQPNRHVGTHVVIDTDGTRYIMCRPDQVTHHAGASLLDGREKCNLWTLGIEFQGDTQKWPLTEDQVNSAIEWLVPLIIKYHIPIRNIVTHQMIRTAYKKAHPESKAYNKPDITQEEYVRFMKALKASLPEGLE